MAKLVVLIAGNICSGKTTLLNYIKEKEHNFKPFLNDSKGEELKVVSEFIDPTIMELFYLDRKRYSSWFEQSCLIGRIGRYLEAKNFPGVVFFDRGMIEGAETFCKNSYEEGMLRKESYELYKKILFNGLDDLDRTEQGKWLEQMIIYLEVKDEGILLERNRKRNTRGETIPLEYFRKINALYENLIANVSNSYKKYELTPPEVLTIDASRDLNHDLGYLSRTFELIIKNIGALTQDQNKE